VLDFDALRVAPHRGRLARYADGLTNILFVGGLSTPVATNSFPGGTVSFPDSASDAKYNVALTWLNGVVSHVTYASKDSSKTIEVSVSGDGAGGCR